MAVETKSPILEALKRKKVLTEAQVENIEILSAEADMRPLAFLLEDGSIPESIIFEIIAEEAGMPFTDLEDILVDATIANSISGDWARKLRALPFDVSEDGELIVAFDKPPKMSALDDIEKLTGRPVLATLAAPKALGRRINIIFRSEAELEDLTGEIADEDDGTYRVEASDENLNEIPIVKYVNLILTQAITDRASDIHIEPTEKEALVRFRIDGVLHDQTTSRRSVLSAIVSRVKVMSGMDIAEKRKPQDGRMTVRVGGRRVDVRVVTLPTVYGEKLVMRVLDNDGAPTTLKDIGMSTEHRSVYEKFYTRPYGMILVTGPTGSGKSTTLYSTLNRVKKPEVNVITVEDPVEMRIDGVTQMQVNPRAGLTFPIVLSSILRADPDVIMVGEIRDRDTAKLAVESALTGHLVLSTLHTNDAASAVTRLIEMGIEPFLVGSALSLVVAQRLLRKLCKRCEEEYVPSRNELAKAGFILGENDPIPMVKRATGCQNCSFTGYMGRTAIHEILTIDSTVERMANEGAHTDMIRDYAIKSGMLVPMREDGWKKIYEGITTIEEVLRVSI